MFCRTCGSHFVDRFVLKRHYDKEGPFHKDAKCPFCTNISFDSWKEHKDHLDKFHEGVLKYQCGYCGVNYFNTQVEKSNHKTMCKVKAATHMLPQYPDGTDITCTMCFDKVANNLVDVRIHMKEAHSALGEPCSICKEIFFSKKGITDHMKAVHMKMLHCDRCEKVFSSSAKLRNHQASHSMDRDFSKCLQNATKEQSHIYNCMQNFSLWRMWQRFPEDREFAKA